VDFRFEQLDEGLAWDSMQSWGVDTDGCFGQLPALGMPDEGDGRAFDRPWAVGGAHK
jgi:hypothetical protein